MSSASTILTSPTTISYPSAPSVAGTSPVDQSTGAGVVGSAGPVPDVPIGATLTAIMDSVRKLMPEMSGERAGVLLLEVLTKIKDTIAGSEQDRIIVDQSSMRGAIAEKQKTLDEADQRREEAKNKREQMSTWDKVKLAFQYIGAVAAIVGGILALATSVVTGPAGIVSGVLLITAGVLLLGLAGTLHRAELLRQGKTEEQALEGAKKFEGDFRLAVTIVASVLALGGAIAGAGGAISAGQAAVAAYQGVAGQVVNVVSGASGLVGSSVDIATAVEMKKLTDILVDLKELDSDTKTNQALIAAIDDMIDMTLSRLKGVHESFDGMIDSLTEALNDQAATYSRAVFQA